MLIPTDEEELLVEKDMEWCKTNLPSSDTDYDDMKSPVKLRYGYLYELSTKV